MKLKELLIDVCCASKNIKNGWFFSASTSPALPKLEALLLDSTDEETLATKIMELQLPQDMPGANILMLCAQAKRGIVTPEMAAETLQSLGHNQKLADHAWYFLLTLLTHTEKKNIARITQLEAELASLNDAHQQSLLRVQQLEKLETMREPSAALSRVAQLETELEAALKSNGALQKDKDTTVLLNKFFTAPFKPIIPANNPTLAKLMRK